MMLGSAPAWGSERIETLIRSMTLDEKVALMHGAEDPLGTPGSHDPSHQRGAGYWPGLPRLGIPPLRLTDGPAGIRTALPATALPAPLALAASFDRALARRYGEVLGREARANGQQVVLGPMVNIARSPLAGRNFETFGEDPYLATRIAAAEIEGIQSAGAIATAKHLAANNQEDHRLAIDARIDARALHEIYLPAFRAAVQAGVGAVMCGYNAVNGAPACQNRRLLHDILRRQWGFAGWVMSDWGAARSTLPSLEAGLDMEMWAGMKFGPLADLVRTGRVPEARIDLSVRRILGQMERAGLLETGPAQPSANPTNGAAVAWDVAVSGAVLLRNRAGILPLDPARLGSLAVIGPNAAIPLVGGNGSSRVAAPNAKSPLDALRERIGPRLTYEAGTDLDGEPVPPDRLDPGGDWVRGEHAVPAGQRWRWEGWLSTPSAGPYELKLQAGPFGLDPASPWREGGKAELQIDDHPPVAVGGVFGGDASLLPTADGLGNATVPVRFEAGERHRLVLTAEAGRGAPFKVRLAWVTPERRAARLRAAVAAAGTAGTVLMFGYDESGEGHDRPSLALPGNQDEVIEAVARANTRTVVVLNTGGPVVMPWLEQTAAVLEMWYPGQQGANATAAILTGVAEPGGRLPITFPRRLADNPTADPSRYPGRNGLADYGEGLFIGYRWYDAQNIAPLFPFGFGLGYGSLLFSDVEFLPDGTGYDVRVRARNPSPHRVTDVLQVYLRPPDNPPVPMPPRKLAAFARVQLAPGEASTVSARINGQALSYWSPPDGAWLPIRGRWSVSVGPAAAGSAVP
jgi:beta-glucosidase